MEKIRLNKYLSEKGLCSRREADRLTQAGEIFVNGQLAQMGRKVSDQDEIIVSGKAVQKGKKESVILAVNKPVGVVCTTAEFPNEKNIVELIQYPERVYPVGRLDKNSEGLIFLTNDGTFMNQLLNAANGHEKEYVVEIDEAVTQQFLQEMGAGMYLPELEKTTAPCKIWKTGENSFHIILTQGLNRQIRRMCKQCGCNVVKLQRIRILDVKLGDLKSGEYRMVEGEEKAKLLLEIEKEAIAFQKKKENQGKEHT